MKIHFFGTCSGTRPVAGTHHLSFAIETGGGYYWFDAGETCSYTAHLMGVDLLKIRKIFISHPHMDHVGGLGNLLWTIRKLTQGKNGRQKDGDIHIHIPDLTTLDGFMQVLKNTEGNFEIDFQIFGHEVVDGLVADDGILRVTAQHNGHLPHEDGTPWRSFSYLIEAEDKRIVFSGDIKAVSDLAPLMENGCDALIMETGHHKVADACAELAARDWPIKRLWFAHNGPDILKDVPAAAERAAQSAFAGETHICWDGETLEL
ncbi:MAG: ribonuclease Z [Clostridia bacterium]|nr:ribonuclease Z [Clostridia bacterium]